MRFRYDWLRGLAENTLSDEEIVKGYVRFYALRGLTIRAAQNDIHRISDSSTTAAETMVVFLHALERYAEDSPAPAAEGGRRAGRYVRDR